MLPFQKLHLYSLFTPDRSMLVPQVYVLVRFERVPPQWELLYNIYRECFFCKEHNEIFFYSTNNFAFSFKWNGMLFVQIIFKRISQSLDLEVQMRSENQEESLSVNGLNIKSIISLISESRKQL